MLTQKQLTDAIVQVTVEYTEQYLAAFKKKKLDKQLWAALHLGFVAAMKLNGYSEEDLMTALEAAQKEIARVLK
jgi:hypothetical protein